MRALGLAALVAVACTPSSKPSPPSAALVDAGAIAIVDAGASAADAAIQSASPGPDPSCAQPGCLRSARRVGDFTKAQIVPFLDARVTIDNGYTVWTIEYATSDRSSLATVTIPFGVAAPPEGFAIVANNHGTTGIEDPCKLAGTVYGVGLAGLFGARGAIGVAPDYPGLGTSGIHPYLVSESEGRASLDAMRATRSLARWQGIPSSNRFAAVGLSQGGHATLAAAAAHATYAPDLDVRAFAVAAPANMFEEQWRKAIAFDGPHVAFHAMLVYAWAEHYGWTGPSPWAPGAESAIRSALTGKCVFDMGSGTIDAALGGARARIFAPAFLSAYQSGSWGPYAAFSSWFTANRIKPFSQTAPVKIYQGDADTIVPEAGTRALVESLRAAGMTIDYEVVPGGTHVDVAYGFVAAFEKRTVDSIAWVRNRLASPK